MGLIHTRQRVEVWRTALQKVGLEPGPLVYGDVTIESGSRAADTKPCVTAAVAPGRGWTWSADGERRGAAHSPMVRVTGRAFAITR